MTACAQRVFIDQHFRGTIRLTDERAMRAHLAGCPHCTRHYRRHLLLARLDPLAPPAEERLLRPLGLSTQRRAMPPPLFLAVAAALACAAGLVLSRPIRSADDGFTARGAASLATDTRTTNAPATRAQASHVLVYAVPSDGAPHLASGPLARGDGLAFAYVNTSAKARMMIFGVDERHRVYWFYPAWKRDTDDPSAIAIESDPSVHSLAEAIHYDIEGTHLDIRAVFADDAPPLTVTAVEALLRDDPDAPLPIPGAVENRHSLAFGK